MKRYALLGLLLFAIGCDSMGLPKSKKSAKVEEPETMDEWVARANAEKKPCTGGYGGGTGGYHSWSMSCEKGVWVYKDTTAQSREWEGKENDRKSSLAKALVSRCLTAKEMAEVTDRGYDIYVRPMQQYFEKEMEDKFNAALLTQQLLQIHCPKADTQGGTPQEKQ